MLAPSETIASDLGTYALSLLAKPGEEFKTGESLDPADWDGFRAESHRMLDDMLDYTQHVRNRPVWRPVLQGSFREALPQRGHELGAIHRRFLDEILPYTVGNVHPGFMGWVHGGGTPVGMLAEMLAAGLNSNAAGRNQAPVEVERQVVQWVRELFRFPSSASGLFVTGTSIANFIAVLVARRKTLGEVVRGQGITDPHLMAYASQGVHRSMAQAMDFAGIGSDHLRLVPVNDQHQINVKALEEMVIRDRRAGLRPFLVTGCAGTVDVGAVDDLAALARFTSRYGLWFHVDGAYGALGVLADDVAPLLRGIQTADSIAFDFHKWGQVPYDAGFVLVRDGALHESTFALPACYLSRESRGLAAGSPWPCDFGPDQSRGFRALKTWFTIQVYGARKLGEMISNTCALARYLRDRVEAESGLELLAPVALNIVCFRCRGSGNLDEVNRSIVADLQESGIVAPSTTVVNGRLAIRAAIVNHRTSRKEIDTLIEATLHLAERYV